MEPAQTDTATGGRMIRSRPRDEDGFPVYSRAERLIDTALHVTGLGAAVIAAPILIGLAAVWHWSDPAVIAAAAIYGASLVAMFAASAGYHLWLGAPRFREWLRRIDHAAIYAKIAGTYTPFTVLLGGERALPILAGMWSAAGLGILLRLFGTDRLEWLMLLLYLAMGWAVVVVGGPILGEMSTAAVVLMLVGGGLYTVGVAFHLWHSLPYQNAIWHGFVLAASFVFYAAVTVEIVS